MAGHFGKPGAIRKGPKKGSRVGSGGQRRARLEGKGPTPKAEDRTYHPAYRRKQAAEAAAAKKAGPKLRGFLQIPDGHELIAGRNPVAEAVASGIPYTRVFLASSLANDERLSSIVRAAAAAGAPIIEVTRLELDKMTDGTVHQGVAIEVPPYAYASIDELMEAGMYGTRKGLIVALDSITDPHNLGAVARCASAFHVDGILLPERRSAGVNATAWKVSAGAMARVPVAREKNLVRALEELKAHGYFVVGLAGEGSETIDQLALSDMPLVIVTGSEDKGLSRLVRETCDVIASIPIASEMESLNAAVATGIALYQIDRFRATAETAQS